jgi:anti-anti-sigma factor
MCIFPFGMSSSPDEIKIQRNGFVLTVTPSGELDLVTALALARVLRDAAAPPVSEVRVVLGDVTFIDSTGMSALFCGWRAAEARRKVARPPVTAERKAPPQ